MTNVIELSKYQGLSHEGRDSLGPEMIREASNKLLDEILPANLSGTEIRILLFVFNRTITCGIPHVRLSGEEIADAVSCDRANAGRLLSKLLSKGFLYRTGGSRSAVGISCLMDISGLLVSVNVLGQQSAPEAVSRDGFIYMLSNEAMPGIFKVGMTCRSPHARIEELSKSTSAPAPFELVHAIAVDNPLTVERRVHQLLAKHRISANREFFRITSEEFLGAVQEAVGGGL